MMEKSLPPMLQYRPPIIIKLLIKDLLSFFDFCQWKTQGTSKTKSAGVEKHVTLDTVVSCTVH